MTVALTLVAALGIAGLYSARQRYENRLIRISDLATAGANLAGAAVSGLSQLAGLGGKSASIPFFIQGTTSDPKFVPDVQGIVKSQLSNQLQGNLPKTNNPNANQAIDALTGLFGKKKKKQ